MDELQCYCTKHLEELDAIIQSSEKCLREAPDGTLNTVVSGQKVQYYWRTDNKDTHGKYIKKSEVHIAKQLAQKAYALKMRNAAKIKKKKLLKWMNGYKPDELRQIYESLTEEKQKLVTPYILPDDKFIQMWEAEIILEKKKHKIKDPIEGKEIYTEKGEVVRSKSEKILADKLYKLGIPYVYEPALYLKGYGYVNPDFIILNPRTRKEYYWEHLGLMGNVEYCEKSIKKIETYIKNHIIPGKQLILSYETDNYVLNMKVAEELIKEYLL